MNMSRGLDDHRLPCYWTNDGQLMTTIIKLQLGRTSSERNETQHQISYHRGEEEIPVVVVVVSSYIICPYSLGDLSKRSFNVSNQLNN
jgi:hypothetical protein